MPTEEIKYTFTGEIPQADKTLLSLFAIEHRVKEIIETFISQTYHGIIASVELYPGEDPTKYKFRDDSFYLAILKGDESGKMGISIAPVGDENKLFLEGFFLIYFTPKGNQITPEKISEGNIQYEIEYSLSCPPSTLVKLFGSIDELESAFTQLAFAYITHIGHMADIGKKELTKTYYDTLSTDERIPIIKKFFHIEQQKDRE